MSIYPIGNAIPAPSSWQQMIASVLPYSLPSTSPSFPCQGGTHNIVVLCEILSDGVKYI